MSCPKFSVRQFAEEPGESMMNEVRKRKSKGPSFNVYVAVSFPNETFCEIENLVQQVGLAKAQLVRELFLRGLAAYHRDGRVSEVVEQDRNVSVSQFAEEGAINVAA
jgi:hypothetical protein